MKEHNPNWTQIPDHAYRILIIGCFGSGKKSLFNLISHQPDIYKFMYINHFYDMIPDMPSKKYLIQ